jgi:hypothetical protein
MACGGTASLKTLHGHPTVTKCLVDDHEICPLGHGQLQQIAVLDGASQPPKIIFRYCTLKLMPANREVGVRLEESNCEASYFHFPSTSSTLLTVTLRRFRFLVDAPLLRPMQDSGIRQTYSARIFTRRLITRKSELQ